MLEPGLNASIELIKIYSQIMAYILMNKTKNINI